MEMPDRLASVVVGVDDDAITRIRESLVSGNLSREAQQLAQLGSVVHVVKRVYMPPRNHQQVTVTRFKEPKLYKSELEWRFVGGAGRVSHPSTATDRCPP